MMNMNTQMANGYIYDENYGSDEFSMYNNYSHPYYSYANNDRYNNAYGNYHGGYNRSNNGPQHGFGPPGPADGFWPPDYYGSHGPQDQYGYFETSENFGPHRPPLNGRRTGYDGSSGTGHRHQKRDRIINYLIKYGIPREKLTHLPHELLNLMQPLNCGLCGQTYETHDLARIHYVSKNHFKSQKRWLNLRFDSSNARSKDPLKARELYCELCDVQITSTEHAQSHYAGKIHRAVVDGRKKPRNPFLLQPLMQQRLAALIRRELKFIKKTPPPAEQKTKAHNKPVTPELFCYICKIRMMCSEQMTTHLNGKRHLNKEKQHILKLMKGEIQADIKKDATIGTTEEDALEDEDGNEDEDADGSGDRDDDEDGDAGAAAADDSWGDDGDDWKPSAEDY